MKGYDIDIGYMGWTGEEYMLFACEQDYKEWMEDEGVYQDSNNED